MSDIEQGLRIMVVGMVAVFCFLILMVLAMNVSGWVLSRWAPEEAPVDTHGDEEIAVALAAIQAHTN